MKNCPNCGFKLGFRNEKFCPQCGINLTEKKDASSEDKPNLVTITGTMGDMVGTGVSGRGYISGKDHSYVIRGNVITINLSDLSPDILENLQNIRTLPTQIDIPQSQSDEVEATNDKNIPEPKGLIKQQQQISEILNQVKEIDSEKGTKIQQINAGEFEISTKELVLKDTILQANRYFYDRKYAEAISMYDYATKLDPNNYDIWFNKGYACMKLEYWNDAIVCYDKYLEKFPNNSVALNNKAYALAHIGRNKEALTIIEQSLNINPHSGYALDTMGFVLYNLGRFEDAVDFYSRAIKKDSNKTRWSHKALALDKLGRHKEALECYVIAEKLGKNSVS